MDLINYFNSPLFTYQLELKTTTNKQEKLINKTDDLIKELKELRNLKNIPGNLKIIP